MGRGLLLRKRSQSVSRRLSTVPRLFGQTYCSTISQTSDVKCVTIFECDHSDPTANCIQSMDSFAYAECKFVHSSNSEVKGNVVAFSATNSTTLSSAASIFPTLRATVGYSTFTQLLSASSTFPILSPSVSPTQMPQLSTAVGQSFKCHRLLR